MDKRIKQFVRFAFVGFFLAYASVSSAAPYRYHVDCSNNTGGTDCPNTSMQVFQDASPQCDYVPSYQKGKPGTLSCSFMSCGMSCFRTKAVATACSPSQTAHYDYISTLSCK